VQAFVSEEAPRSSARVKLKELESLVCSWEVRCWPWVGAAFIELATG